MGRPSASPPPAPSRRSRCTPRARTSDGDQAIADVRTRGTTEVHAYGWTPEQFVRQQLLQFCFTAEDERNTQVGFVEQAARLALLRRLRRLEGDDTGAIVIADAPTPTARPPTSTRSERRTPPSATAGDGRVVRNFSDLIDVFDAVLRSRRRRA